MTLLGWMHRKLRSSNDLQKDLSLGQVSLIDQQCYAREGNGNKYQNKPQEDKFRRSFIAFEATKIDEDFREEPAAALTDLFHGFLTIGTLGTESHIKDPDTTKFSISVDSISEEKTEDKEDKLELIENLSEKVLEGDHNDENNNDSSDRVSLISSAEKSESTLITLGNKRAELAETYGTEGVTCRKQSCPLRSTVEVPAAAKSLKKKHTTLEELFHKTEQAEENSGIKSHKGKKIAGKEPDNSSIHLIKKFMKKRTVHGLGKSFTHDSGGTSQSTPKEKLHKIMKTFSRKVHPDDALLGPIHHKPGKIWSQIRTSCTMEKSVGGRRSLDGDIIINPQDVFPNQIFYSENQSHAPLLTKARLSSTGNEFWIKTDADYVVLEL